MAIRLDNAPLEFNQLDQHARVHRALEVARRVLAPTGRLVFGIRCDGRDYGPHEIDGLLNRSISEFEDLEFISARSETVVVEALVSSRAAISETFAAVRRVSELLNAGQIAPAMETLLACLEIWGKTHEAMVQSAAIAQLDFERILVGQRPLIDGLKDIVGHLRSLRDAVDAKDYVSLSDVLHYELDDMLTGWENVLDRLIQEIRGRDEASASHAVHP